MKITLTKATFYFNEPINLTPYTRTLDVDLTSLDDQVVRKLNLGVITGVIDIVEGADDFKARVETLLTSKDSAKETNTEVVEVVAEVEPKTEVKPEVKEVEEPKRKTATPAKKTTSKKV